MFLKENILNDSFVDISVNMGNLQINFILQTGFFDFESDWLVSSHFHSWYEIHFIHEGKIELVVDNQTFTLNKNDICIIPPHLNHYTNKVLIPTKKASLLMNFSYIKDNEDSEINEYEIYYSVYKNIEHMTVIQNSDIFDRYLKNIHDIFEKNQISGIHKAKAIFALIFFEVTEKIADVNAITDNFKYANNHSVRMHEEANYADNIRIVKIENYINENFTKDITLCGLSNYLHLSEKQTARMLRKLIGLSFGKLLIKRRMESARELILNSDISIREIAYQIGYGSYNGFYSAFKSLYDISPQALRDMRHSI